MRPLYCDTASRRQRAAARGDARLLRPTHILFGSDYPFIVPDREIEELEHYPMTPAMRAAIDRENALLLLPRFKIA